LSKENYADLLSKLSIDAQQNGSEEKVQIERYKANEVNLDILMNSPGILVLSDLFFPGWQVYDNEEKKEMLNVDYMLRGIYLDSGRHTVRFAYEPSVLKYGLYASVFFLVLGILLFIFFPMKKFSLQLGNLSDNSASSIGDQI